MTRPSNWYDMDYDSQREWESNERKHQNQVRESEDEAYNLREEARQQRQSDDARKRQLANERDEMAEEAGEARRSLSDALDELALRKRFMHETKQVEAYEAWKAQWMKDTETEI